MFIITDDTRERDDGHSRYVMLSHWLRFKNFYACPFAAKVSCITWARNLNSSRLEKIATSRSVNQSESREFFQARSWGSNMGSEDSFG